MPDTPRPPLRIQRRRTKGWRMPPGAIYVGRGSKWGNPYRVGYRDLRTTGTMDADTVVERFLEKLVSGRLAISEVDVRSTLRGHDLACWCAIGRPCHADVLLEIANRPEDDHA